MKIPCSTLALYDTESSVGDCFSLNYKQIIFEHRLNRFVFTSVVYPAMLILGFIVTKLDNKLAYGVRVKV